MPSLEFDPNAFLWSVQEAFTLPSGVFNPQWRLTVTSGVANVVVKATCSGQSIGACIAVSTYFESQEYFDRVALWAASMLVSKITHRSQYAISNPLIGS